MVDDICLWVVIKKELLESSDVKYELISSHYAQLHGIDLFAIVATRLPSLVFIHFTLFSVKQVCQLLVITNDCSLLGSSQHAHSS